MGPKFSIDLSIAGPPIHLWGCPPRTWSGVWYLLIRLSHPPTDEAVLDALNQFPCEFASSRSTYHDFHSSRLVRLTESSRISLSSKLGGDTVPNELSVVPPLCSAYLCKVYYILMISVAKYLLLLTSPLSRMSVRERLQGNSL